MKWLVDKVRSKKMELACVCSGSLRSSRTVSNSRDGNPLLILRSDRRLTGRCARPAVEKKRVESHVICIIKDRRQGANIRKNLPLIKVADDFSSDIGMTIKWKACLDCLIPFIFHK